MTDGYLCPKCGKDTVRTQVSLTVDIPSSLEHRLNKRNIATKDVVVMGASWDTAASYCPCGWSMSLLKTRLDDLHAEVERLRAVLCNVRDGYDCDEDAHKYNTICRCCDAAAALMDSDNDVSRVSKK